MPRLWCSKEASVFNTEKRNKLIENFKVKAISIFKTENGALFNSFEVITFTRFSDSDLLYVQYIVHLNGKDIAGFINCYPDGFGNYSGEFSSGKNKYPILVLN